MKWGLSNMIFSVGELKLQRKISKVAQTFCFIGNGTQGSHASRVKQMHQVSTQWSRGEGEEGMESAQHLPSFQ